MKLSDLGLTQEEVNAIMADVAGGGQTVTAQREPAPQPGVPAPSDVPKPIITVAPVRPAVDNTRAADVGTSMLPQRPSVLPAAVIPPKPVVPGKPGVGAYIAAAGAGFLVGGPVGAAVGAGAVALLGAGKKAPVPAPKPVIQQSAVPTLVAAAAAPPPAKVAQVTPTSAAAQPAKAPVTERTLTTTRTAAGAASAALASRLKLT